MSTLIIHFQSKACVRKLRFCHKLPSLYRKSNRNFLGLSQRNTSLKNISILKIQSRVKLSTTQLIEFTAKLSLRLCQLITLNMELRETKLTELPKLAEKQNCKKKLLKHRLPKRCKREEMRKLEEMLKDTLILLLEKLSLSKT